MKGVKNLFARGKTGALVFDERPFLTYNATVTNMKKFEIYAGNSGVLSVEITAYYPFALMDRISVVGFDDFGAEYGDFITNATGMLMTPIMPPNIITTALNATTSFLLYNGGDERADTSIRIAGDVGTGISIYNSATKQTCRITGIIPQNTSLVNKWLELDSASGKVYLTDGGTSNVGFAHHDRGFIQLEGNPFVSRGISISYASNIVTSDGLFTPDMQGKYLHIGGIWRKINQYLSPTTVKINHTYGAGGVEGTDVVTMNYITITPDTTMDLSQLEFYYFPTFN